MQNIVMKLTGRILNFLTLITPKTAGWLGFALFSHPVRSKIRKKHWRFLNTANQFKINHNNEKVQIYRWGEGPKRILFLHGWQSHTYRWKAYIESIDKNKFTIYAFDAPGHGQSTGSYLTAPFYSEVIQQFIEHTGPMDIVVGHSFGSFTAIYTFFRHPGLKPKKLITLATPGGAREFFEYFCESLDLSNKTAEYIKSRFFELFSRQPDYFSALRFSRNLSIPGLIIHDKEDNETSFKNSLLVHRAWEGSRIMITKGMGHSLKTEEVLEEVIDFVDQQNESKYAEVAS